MINKRYYKKRLNARQRAVQAIYASVVNPQQSIEDSLAYLSDIYGDLHLDREFCFHLAKEVYGNFDDLLKQNKDHNHNVKANIIDWIILCCGYYEMNKLDLHRNIIISTYIELSIILASKNFYKVINMSLDREKTQTRIVKDKINN